MKKILAGIGLVIALTVFALVFARDASAPGPKNSSTKATDIVTTPGFDKKLHSINEQGSIWWIVNKVSPLNPIDYAPTDLVTPTIKLRPGAGSSEMRLRQEAANALEQMVVDAEQADISIMLVSGYRPYQTQVSVYNGYVQQYGQAGADKISARPGTSEHQTGLATDIGSVPRLCELEVCFGNLPEGKWLAANAYIYGFIVRYPEGKEKVTGYDYEPWHLRYVGKDLSLEMHKQNVQTLEEFFGVVPESQPY